MALADLLNWAAQQTGVPLNILSGVASVESGGQQFDQNGNVTTSNKGALGIMQLMPGTASGLGVNPNDPQQNVLGGASLLKQLFGQYGNWTDALSAYHGDPIGSAAGASYAAKVLNAGGAAQGSAQGSTSIAPSGSVAQASGITIYGFATVLIIGLTLFGLYAMVRE